MFSYGQRSKCADLLNSYMNYYNKFLISLNNTNSISVIKAAMPAI